MLPGQGWTEGALFNKKVRQHTISNDTWVVRVTDYFKTSDQIIGKFGFTLRISGPQDYEMSLKDSHPDIRRMILRGSRLLIIGRKKNSYMTVVNLDQRKVIDRFVVDEPLFSSDERYMAFHLPKSRTSSRRPGPIFLYDLGRTPRDNRIGLAKENFNINNVQFWQVDVGLMLWPEYNLKNQVTGAKPSTPELRLGFSKWADNVPIFGLVGTDQKTNRDWIGLVDLSQGLEDARVKALDFVRGELIDKNSRFHRAEAKDIQIHDFGRVTLKGSELVNDAQSISIDMFNPDKDLQAPEIEKELKGSSESEGKTYFGTSGKIEFTGRDVGINPSGIERIEYSLDGEQNTVSDSRLVIETDLLTEGTHELTGRVVDAAGNASPEKTLKFTVDRAPPTTSHSVEYIDPEKKLIFQNSELKLTGEDEETSLQKIEIRYKEFPWITYNPNKPLKGLYPGSHYIRYRGVDRAGNKEPAHRLDFKTIDIPADSFTLPAASASRYGPARHSFQNLRRVTEGKFQYEQLRLKIKGQTFTTADAGVDFSIGNFREGKTYPHELSVWPDKLVEVEGDEWLECKLIVPIKFSANDEILELEFTWAIQYSQAQILINELNPRLDTVEIYAAGHLDMDKISLNGKLSVEDFTSLSGPMLASDSEIYRTVTTELKSTDGRML
jgi:hypothetical protein